MLHFLLPALLVLVGGAIQAQTVLVINGANSGTPALFIKSGAHITVGGGIRIDDAGTSGSGTDYLQNNGTLHILSDQQNGQSDFINNVNGLITYTAGQSTGEVIFAADNETQAITGSGNSVFMKLTTSNSQTPVLDLQQSVDVDGLFALGGATTNLNSTTLSLNGTFSSAGTLSGLVTSDLLINGSGDLGSPLTFAPSVEVLRSLTINRTNASGHSVLLGSSLSVSLLTVSDGILNVQEFDLRLAAAGSLTGAPFTMSNMIQTDGPGRFIREINSGAASYYFPVGDGTPAFSPVTLNFSSNEAPGSVGVNVTPTTHPQINNPSAATSYLNRYWSFTSENLTAYTYTGTFEYPGSAIQGTESALKLGRWAAPWYAIESSSAASNTLTINSTVVATDASLNGDFTGRDVECMAEAGLVTSTGDDTLCSGNTAGLLLTGNSGPVQWQSSAENGNFMLIENATNTTFTSSELAETTWFRAYTGSGACADTTNAFPVVVKESPVALFSAVSSSGYVVQFTNESSSGTTYEWIFGDGTTSSETSPSHTFPFDDTYVVSLVADNACETDTFSLQVAAIKVGLLELESQQLQVWPNPFSDYIIVKAGSGHEEVSGFTVCNVLGEVVYSRTNGLNEQPFRINLSNQPAGIYSVVLNHASGNTIRKIIKLNP